MATENGRENRSTDRGQHREQQGERRAGGKKDGFRKDGDRKEGFRNKRDSRSGYSKDRGQRKGNGGYNPYDKDREDKRETRTKSSSASKEKVSQPDKVEIINRIEKEKKAMQKKMADRKNGSKNKANRPAARPKRTGNIDWTKAYENDSYDDDDFDIYL